MLSDRTLLTKFRLERKLTVKLRNQIINKVDNYIHDDYCVDFRGNNILLSESSNIMEVHKDLDKLISNFIRNLLLSRTLSENLHKVLPEKITMDELKEFHQNKKQ